MRLEKKNLIVDKSSYNYFHSKREFEKQEQSKSKHRLTNEKKKCGRCSQQWRNMVRTKGGHGPSKPLKNSFRKSIYQTILIDVLYIYIYILKADIVKNQLGLNPTHSTFEIFFAFSFLHYVYNQILITIKQYQQCIVV